MSCSNNIKQLAIGLHGFSDANHRLPYASHKNKKSIRPDSTSSHSRTINWVIEILPFTENETTYSLLNKNANIADGSNEGLRSTSIETMLCPSDVNNRTPFNGTSVSRTAAYGDNWARGNYAANCSLGLYSSFLHAPLNALRGDNWNDPMLRGVMGYGRTSSFKHITDGTSNTVMLAEIRPESMKEIHEGAGPCLVLVQVNYGDMVALNMVDRFLMLPVRMPIPAQLTTV